MLGSYTSPSFTSTLLNRTTPASLGKGFRVSPAEKDTRDGARAPGGTGCTPSQARPRPVCGPEGRPRPLISPQGGHHHMRWTPSLVLVGGAGSWGSARGPVCQAWAWHVHDVWGWGTQAPPPRPPLPPLLPWLMYLGRLQAAIWGTLKNRMQTLSEPLTAPHF